MPTNTQNAEIPNGTRVRFTFAGDIRYGVITDQNTTGRGLTQYEIRGDNNTDYTTTVYDDRVTIEPLTDVSILALASQANTAANAYRDGDPDGQPNLITDLLAAVDALTTAICDAEA